jgi:hypothetical protein
MKRILSAVLLIVVFSTAALAGEIIASGTTNSTLGNYKIESTGKTVTVNGEPLKAYLITYQNSPMELTVLVQPEKKCKNYIVLSDKLSVTYVCNGDYFGVQKLDKSLEMDGFSTSDEALNRSEYFHQKLIVPGKQSEVQSTELIAIFFPMLIKDEFVATK